MFRSKAMYLTVLVVMLLSYSGTGQAAPTDQIVLDPLELAVWEPITGDWHIAKPDGSYKVLHYGQEGDYPFAGRFDILGTAPGDKEDRFMVWRPSDGTWYFSTGDPITENVIAVWEGIQLGQEGDIPVPADYDGDGFTEIGVWTPSTGMWVIAKDNVAGQIDVFIRGQVGMEGDIPIPGDYDGDGMDEFAVWRPQDHTFYVSLNNTDWAGNPVLIVKIDGAGEIPIKGNFDDDPADEMGVWRESDGVWTIALDNSTQTNDPNDYLIVQTGMQGDIPIAADYEGDGMDEIAVWRPVDGSYFINYHNVDWATCPLDECIAVRTDVPNGTPVPGQFERTY